MKKKMICFLNVIQFSKKRILESIFKKSLIELFQVMHKHHLSFCNSLMSISIFSYIKVSNFCRNRFSASYDKGVKVPSKSTVTDAYSKYLHFLSSFFKSFQCINMFFFLNKIEFKH